MSQFWKSALSAFAGALFSTACGGCAPSIFWCQVITCEADCDSCSDSTTCTQCKASKYLHSANCLTACPSAYYGIGSGTIGRSCQACESNCNTCSSRTACSQCKNSKYYAKYLHNADCVNSCPTGYSGSGTGTTGRTCQVNSAAHPNQPTEALVIHQRRSRDYSWSSIDHQYNVHGLRMESPVAFCPV